MRKQYIVSTSWLIFIITLNMVMAIKFNAWGNVVIASLFAWFLVKRF